MVNFTLPELNLGLLKKCPGVKTLCVDPTLAGARKVSAALAPSVGEDCKLSCCGRRGALVRQGQELCSPPAPRNVGAIRRAGLQGSI